MLKQTSFYACGKGFFQDYLPSSLDSNIGINELTKIDLFDHIFDQEEELLKIEIKGLNMLMLTQSGSAYFTNSIIRFPSRFSFPSSDDGTNFPIIIDCSLSQTHALFLTNGGVIYSWNLKKKSLDDLNGIKKLPNSFDCKIFRVLAFDNGQSFFIGPNMKVFMSEGGGSPNSVDIRKIQLCEEKAFVYGMDLEEKYFKGLNKVIVTKFHEIDQASDSIFLVGDVNTYRMEMASFLCYQTPNDKILDMACSNSHMIITSRNRLVGMGHNESGQLGTKNFLHGYYDDGCEVVLPFEREDDDNIMVAVDDGLTLIAHTRYVKKSSMNEDYYPSLFRNVDKSTAQDFAQLVELVSKDCSNLMRNDNFLSCLNENELELFNKLLEFISFKLYDFNLVDEDENYKDLLFEIFRKDMKNTITTLFLLNDISDLGNRIKETIFSIFLESLSLENVMESLEKISNYLSLQVLNNSKTSLLMLAVKACFTFMKKHYQSVSEKYTDDSRFEKIRSKVQQSKTSSLLEIAINWCDPCKGNVSPVELMNSLYGKGELTFIMDHLGERSLKVHKSIVSCSPVLGTLTNNVFGDIDTTEYNIYDFVVNSQDSEDERICKSNIIESIIQGCYMNFNEIDNLSNNFSQLMQVFLIAHQFQIEHIIKYSAYKILNKMNAENFENVLWVASVVEHEEWGAHYLNKFTVNYLKTIEPLRVPIKVETDLNKKLQEFSKKFNRSASISAPISNSHNSRTGKQIFYSRQVFFTACNIHTY